MKIDLSAYQNNTSLYQSQIWEIFQTALHGKNVYRLENFLVVEINSTYCVFGITKNQLSNDFQTLDRLVNQLETKSTGKAGIRLDFQILDDDEITPLLRKYLIKKGFLCSKTYYIPRFRCIVDYSKGIQEIVSNYYGKTLNDIKRAEKNGVSIQKHWDVDKFYPLYYESSIRQNFKPYNINYFKTLIENSINADSIMIFTAHKDDLPILATALVGVHNSIAYYLYTGSSELYRNLNAPSLLQHKIIEYLDENKIKIYDMMGIRIKTLEYGPTRFKLKFGSYVVQLIDNYFMDL